MKIIDRTMEALNASLHMRRLRQELITSNIANADTPDYKAKRLDFERALARAVDVDGQLEMKTQGKQHYDVGGGGFNNLGPEIYNDKNGDVSEDGNTVNRDEEMVKMAENKILFDASVQLLNKKLGQWRYLINDER